MIVIPRHDPSRSGSGSEKSANVVCSPFVGHYGDRSLRPGFSVMEPVVDSACIVIARRAVRQGRPCPTGPSSNLLVLRKYTLGVIIVLVLLMYRFLIIKILCCMSLSDLMLGC